MTTFERLVVVALFMADRMIATGYAEKHPATWGHIVRELRKCGLEVR